MPVQKHCHLEKCPVLGQDLSTESHSPLQDLQADFGRTSMKTSVWPNIPSPCFPCLGEPHSLSSSLLNMLRSYCFQYLFSDSIRFNSNRKLGDDSNDKYTCSKPGTSRFFLDMSALCSNTCPWVLEGESEHVSKG